MGKFAGFYDEEDTTHLQDEGLLVDSLSTNPDAYARTVKAAKIEGLPTEAVVGKEEEIEQSSRFSEIQGYNLKHKSPAVHQAWQDIDFARVSHDDVEQLTTLERMGGEISEYGGDLKESFTRGQAIVKVGDLATKEAFSELSAEESKELEEARAVLNKPVMMDGNYFTNAPEVAVETLPVMGEVIQGTVGGAIVGYAFDKLLKTNKYAKIFSLGGAGFQMFELEGGNLRDEIGALRDEEGNLISEEVKTSMQIGGGIINTFAETAISVWTLASLFMPKKYAKRVLGSTLSKLLLTPSGKSIMANMAKRLGGVMLVNGIQEGAQESTNIVFAEMAKLVDEHSFKDATLKSTMKDIFSEENAERVGHSFVAGTQMSMVLGGLGTLVSGVAQKRLAENVTESENDRITKIRDVAVESKTREREQEGFEAFMQQASPDGTIYVDAEAAQEYINTLEEDDAVTELLQEKIDAVSEGDDIEISIAEFTTKLAGSGHDDAILNHMRLKPESPSKASLSGYVSETERIMQLMVDKNMATEAAVEESKTLYKQFANQLMTTGRMTKRDAKAYARLYQMRVAVLASYPQNADKTMTELAQEIGLTVEGDNSARAEAAGIVPPSVFAQTQDLSKVELVEERVTPNGESVTITRNAQQEWDITRDRRAVAETLMGCINA